MAPSLFTSKRKLNRWLPLAGLFIFIIIFLSPTSGKALLEKPAKDTSWHITAEKGTHDQAKDLYIADGKVVIKGGNTRLEADHVEFNNTTRDALAQGHVLLISGEDTVTCEALRLNLLTETGTIYDGTVFIQENNFYIRGDKITKTGKETYQAEKASLTSCSGENPDWKISARNVKVTIGGYGLASHAKLFAKKVPAIYTPFLVFPVKTQRQTGLLAPQYNLSDRKGFEFNQPLFLALSRNSDATIYTDYMDKRGTKLGIEYRYLLGKESRGTVLFDYLKDSKIDDGTAANDDYGYDITPDRTNRDRYWFRMKHNQKLPDGWKAKLDLDLVSDADYLHEFKDGYTGFKKTRDQFENIFGRSIDDFDDTTRANQFNLNKTWSVYSLNMDIDWYDDVVAKRTDSEDTALQTLPAMDFNSTRQRIMDSPLYFDLGSGYRNFFRNDLTDSKVKGQRMDLNPTLYLPMGTGRHFSLSPSLGIRESLWYADEYNYESGNDEGFQHRELFDFKLKLATEMSRIFNSDNSFAEKVKHEIIPALEYNYIPDIDQKDLPFFDSLDRIARRNDVTWSVTNRFISRKKKPVSTPPLAVPLTETPKEEYLYQEFAWIKLFQTAYFEDQTHYDEDIRFDSSQSFSDISLESEFSPFTWFSLDLDLDFSPYENRFMEYATGFTIRDIRKDCLQIMYRNKEERSEPIIQDHLETIYTRLDTIITNRLNAFYTYEEDICKKEMVEAVVGVEYRKECWSMLLAYRDKPDDRAFGFIVTLYGIGEFGQK